MKCGACGAKNEADAEFCNSCLGSLKSPAAEPAVRVAEPMEVVADALDAPAPKGPGAESAVTKKKRSVITEVGIFAVFIGLVCAIDAAFTLNGLRGAPDLLGVPRFVALGVPPLGLSLSFLAAGVATLVTRRAGAVKACMWTGVALGVLFILFILFVLIAGSVALFVTPVGLVILAIPVALFVRSHEALAECSANRPVAR